MNPDEDLNEFITMVSIAVRIGQDREWRSKSFCLFAGTIQCVAKNDQNLRSGFDKLVVHAPQLGDVRAALYSIVLTHEEKEIFFAAIIGKCNLAASILLEFEIGCRRTDSQFNV